MESERRNNPRFSVRKNAFAVFGSDPVQLVPIVDVSLGGLKIVFNGIKMSPERVNGSEKLEILIDDCSFFMENLSYRLLPQYRNVTHNPVGARQNIYGVKFINLMPSQLTQLRYFIRNHTKGGMKPKFMRKLNRHLFQFKSKKNLAPACRDLGLQRPSV